MRLSVEPFRDAHLAALVLSGAQLPELQAVPGQVGRAADLGPAFTAFREPVDCSSIVAGDYASAGSDADPIDASGYAGSAGPIDGGDYVAGGHGCRRVVACAGLAENRPGYASAWAFFAEGNGLSTWAGLVGVIRRVFDASGYDRIDTMVRADFAAGHAFARRIGFVQCGLFHRYGADGSDFAIYERIR